jgi:very-short-patch-repair endonuclease
MHPKMPQELVERARKLRLSQTDAETLMWALLRNRQLGCKFRRQHPVLGLDVDFYSHEAKLAVEIDGGQHNKEKGLIGDANRTRSLQRIGIREVRFWNHDVLGNTEAVLEKIYLALQETRGFPHPCPLPEGEGELE